MEETNGAASPNNWIEAMKDIVPVAGHSQNGEESYIKHIFDNIGTFNRFFVDIGAGCYGSYVSNTTHLRERDWSGLAFDMTENGNPHLLKYFVTPYNIQGLLKNYQCPEEFDFLSIDLDSFDYDICEKVLEKYSPRVICMEFNSGLPIGSCLKLQYEEGYTWDKTSKFGFSFGAAKKLAQNNGYFIVYNQKNLNIYMVRKDLIEFEFDEVKAEQRIDHPINNNAVWVTA